MKTTSLAAILFVELAGFNELFARDEAEALALLDTYRKLVEPLIEEHGGELVDATGDELLIVFGSAVGAVQCALHLRLSERVLARAAGTAGRLSPRSGLHLGEIWRDETRVYGNGVNVAARIKSEAGPGQILMSEDVYHQVANKLDLPIRLLDNRPLKNIERPLAIYEILEPGDLRAADDADAPRGSPARGGEGLVDEALARQARELLSLALEKARDGGDSHGGRTGDGGGASFTFEIGDTEPAEARPSRGGAPRLVGPAAIEARMDAARHEIVKGLKNFLGAAAVFAGFMYFYSRGQSVWLLAGGALLGLGPALSGFKRLVKGLFDLKDAKSDARRLEDDRG